MKFIISESMNNLVIIPTIGYDFDDVFLYVTWLKWKIGIIFGES